MGPGERRKLARFDEPRSWVFDVAFDPRGERLVGLANGGRLRVWDARRRRLLSTLGALPLSDHGAVRWRPRGDQVLVALVHELAAFDLATARLAAHWQSEVPLAVSLVDFDAAGEHVLAAHEPGLVQAMALAPPGPRPRPRPARPHRSRAEALRPRPPSDRDARARAARLSLRAPTALVTAAEEHVDAGSPGVALTLLDRAAHLRPSQRSGPGT